MILRVFKYICFLDNLFKSFELCFVRILWEVQCRDFCLIRVTKSSLKSEVVALLKLCSSITERHSHRITYSCLMELSPLILKGRKRRPRNTERITKEYSVNEQRENFK